MKSSAKILAGNYQVLICFINKFANKNTAIQKSKLTLINFF